MTQRTKWNNNYELARIYYEEHGNLCIPANYTVNGLNLGTWLLRQKALYKNDKLPLYRVKKLEDIGINWYDAKQILLQDSWEEKYNLARIYYVEHNDLLIPQDYIINDVKLGSWLSRQRESYKNNELSQDKIKKLEDIGINWYGARELLFQNIWNENYKLALNYYNEHKNLLIKKSYIVDNINLGSWLARQRIEYVNNNLTKDKILKLESIHMIWNSHKEKLLNQLKTEKNYNKINDLILQIIELYSEDTIKNIFYYMDEYIDFSSFDELLKTNMPHKQYQILILYLMGLNHQFLAQMYNMSISEVEKNRLYAFKSFIKLLKISKEKNIKKKVKNV